MNPPAGQAVLGAGECLGLSPTERSKLSSASRIPGRRQLQTPERLSEPSLLSVVQVPPPSALFRVTRSTFFERSLYKESLRLSTTEPIRAKIQPYHPGLLGSQSFQRNLSQPVDSLSGGSTKCS